MQGLGINEDLNKFNTKEQKATFTFNCKLKRTLSINKGVAVKEVCSKQAIEQWINMQLYSENNVATPVSENSKTRDKNLSLNFSFKDQPPSQSVNRYELIRANGIGAYHEIF